MYLWRHFHKNVKVSLLVMVNQIKWEEQNMNSTALGAEKAREIIFIGDAHEKFYYEKLKEIQC